ncbi:MULTISPECIES: MFS transporter [unclassified Streptomyces]|uniref:MFS transporter n=1 Tax=unclassified Streptomyces TaxID=2593676 RepID=UPI0038280B7C
MSTHGSTETKGDPQGPEQQGPEPQILGIPRAPGIRRWLVTAVVDALGTGLALPIVVLYFTQQAGLTAEHVGLGIGIASALGMAAIPAVGTLADRIGAKTVVVAAFLLAALGSGSYLVIHSWAWLVLALFVAQFADGPGRAAKMAFLAQLVDGESRTRLMALHHTIRNIGFGLGGLLAAGALLVDERVGLRVPIVINALSFLVAGLLVATIRGDGRTAARRRPAEGGRSGFAVVLKDWRYVAFATLNGLIHLHASAFTVALPIWVAEYTSAPAAVVGLLFAVNTVLVVLLQMRVSGRVAGPAHVGPVYRRAAATMLFAALIYTLARYVGPQWAVAALVVGVVAHTLAELYGTAGELAISVGLADEERLARYLSVYTLADAAQRAIGPVVVTVLMARATSWSWGLLAVTVAACCLLTAELARRLDPAAGTP